MMKKGHKTLRQKGEKDEDIILCSMQWFPQKPLVCNSHLLLVFSVQLCRQKTGTMPKSEP